MSMIWHWHVTSFTWAACEGKSLTARDLAEIIALPHHPEGRDAKEVPVERKSKGVFTFQHSGRSLGQRAGKGRSGLKSYGSKYSYLIYAQLLLSMPSRFGVQFFRVCQESRF